MGNKKTLIILAAVFVLLLAGASVLYNQLGKDLAPDRLSVQQPQSTPGTTETNPPDPTGTQATQPTATEPERFLAPDFTVYDAEGNPVSLSDFRGKPVVVNFWASWCGPCKMEMPDFQQKYEQLQGEVYFLMVNMTDGQRETVQTASAFIAREGYTFPVYYDVTSEAAMTYGVYYLPTTYFIDAQGHAIAQATSAIDAETLQRGLDMILP